MSNRSIFDALRANLTSLSLTDRQLEKSRRPSELPSNHLPTKARGTRPMEIGLRHDPNIWVCTPEVARRAGMPIEWSSDELQGVAAASFHVSWVASEETQDGDGHCKESEPEMRGVLEFYFDRQSQPLPWDQRIQVADFGCQTDAVAREPFADPQTGQALRFVSEPNALQPSVLDAYQVMAYHREIHARYCFVRLRHNGFDASAFPADGLTVALGSPTRIFHQVFLPSVWTQRVIAMAEQCKL